jgi:hypothetical protein
MPEQPAAEPTPRESVLLSIDAIREANPGITVDMSNGIAIHFTIGKRVPRNDGEKLGQVIIATSLSPEITGLEKLSLVSVRIGEDVGLFHIDNTRAGDARAGKDLPDAALANLDHLLNETDFSDSSGVIELHERFAADKYSNWMHAMFDTEFVR